MKISSRHLLVGAVLAAAGLSNVGCQTYEVGQVLPSPWHLRDDLHYFPRGPRFPLANELNAQQGAEAERTPVLPGP